MSLANWLKCLKSELRSVTRVVIGNEAGDLDSAVSALVLAYILHVKDPKSVTFPLLNYSKNLYSAKTEVVHVLENIDISKNDLFFLPQMKDELEQIEDLDIVLVDHNEPTGILNESFGSSKVSLIIDHHPENPTNMLSCEKSIELVGSCSSLVADYAVKAAVYLPDDAREIIASAIVIDTSGFSPIQLVDDIDRGMFARMTEGKPTDVDSLLAELTSARFKIDGLSIRDLLLKDAKHIVADKNRSIFAATLHCDMGDFLRKEDAWFEIAEFYFSNDCKNADILLLMGTVADGTNRGFGWYSPKMGLDFSEKFHEVARFSWILEDGSL
ncbi:unnamed protein product [Oikopleura dioica]|uniref:DDH domain-containing protein n=1 Tax=Oikopleura dioica TaxID=34765 RepID=E4X2J5_OIKDI|nr:unnamed protein product [Oikopleura dioica]